MPWKPSTGLSAVLRAWTENPKKHSNFVLNQHLLAQAARYQPLPEGLAPAVLRALAARGLDQLYSHQAETYLRATQGEDLVIATPTASGKSLAYNLPVLQALAEAPESRALYLFPTKALSRDQEQSLIALLAQAELPQATVTFDGDTPADLRKSARTHAALLVTNPDMLHAGILPQHARWARFFANLRYIVIDEVHSYRGVFGSHMANLIRRLLRTAAFHGSHPQLLFSSATIQNPEAHVTRLAGRPVGLVSESGAPTADRQLIVANPPVVQAAMGLRQSAVKLAVSYAADLIEHGVSTLIFGNSRNRVEMMLKYLRERTAHLKLPQGAIAGYRGGYLPGMRRRIERGLRSGQVRAVVATNALELGIDIGSLEAVLSVGYPGSLSALWQRFGRGGRRQGQSLAMLVTNSRPLDQFVAQDPSMLLKAPVEAARIDPDNMEILLSHLKCAAYEIPFADTEAFGELPAGELTALLNWLADHGLLRRVPGRNGQQVYHWVNEACPAHAISLRSPSWDNFVIIDEETHLSLAEMDYRATHTMLHEQAIYQHDGQQYQVERLDFKNHKAFVRRVQPDYYTDALTQTWVDLVEMNDSAVMAESLAGQTPLGAGVGEVLVIEKVVGFKKIKYHTHENVGYGEVHLDALQKNCRAFWLTVPEAITEAVSAPRAELIEAWRGVLRALHAVAAVGLMMDPADLCYTLVDEPLVNPEINPVPTKAQDGAQGRQFEPTLYLYERMPGGVGLADRLFVEREALLWRAYQLMLRCPCEQGCPSCIGLVAADPSAAPKLALSQNPKQLAQALLTVAGYGAST